MDTPYEQCLPMYLDPKKYADSPTEADLLELQENLSVSIYMLGQMTTAYISQCLVEDKQHREELAQDCNLWINA